jgi:hypothetical protein
MIALLFEAELSADFDSHDNPLRNDHYVDRCMVGDSKSHAVHHTLLNMTCLRIAFADDYELRSMQRDLC